MNYTAPPHDLKAEQGRNVYNASGGLLGSWTAGGLTAQPQIEGIATNGTDIWLVDNKQEKVFKYTGAGGTMTAFASGMVGSFEDFVNR